jgi:hypothetical protein
MKPSTMSSDSIAYGYGAGSSNQQPYRSQEWNHVQTRRINWRKSAPRKALDFSGCNSTAPQSAPDSCSAGPCDKVLTVLAI